MNKYHEMNEQFQKDMTKAIRESMKSKNEDAPVDVKKTLKKIENGYLAPKTNQRNKKLETQQIK